MFIYEKDNAININFDGNTVETTPDVVIKGYVNGAALFVNGEAVISLENPVEFKPFAKTYMFQRDNKLMLTFNGVEGMSAPEVTIDEVAEGKVEFVVNGEVATINYTEESITVETADKEPEPEVEPIIPEEPVEDLPDHIEGEGDSDATVEDL